MFLRLDAILLLIGTFFVVAVFLRDYADHPIWMRVTVAIWLYCSLVLAVSHLAEFPIAIGGARWCILGMHACVLVVGVMFFLRPYLARGRQRRQLTELRGHR